MDINIGDVLEVNYMSFASKIELLELKRLNYKVTVEDLDIINSKIVGIYTVEFPGYLFTIDQFKI